MEKEYKWCVYKHTSPSGKSYIGITSKKPEYRWNHGKGYRKEDQLVFYRAIQKYGWNNFKHEITVDKIGEKTAKNIEKDLIKFAKRSGKSYNITDGGDGALGLKPMLGKKASIETLKKMSQSHKGLFKGDKNPMYGKHENSPAYGKFGREHPASKQINQYSIEGIFIKTFDSLTEAAKLLGFSQRDVTHITACAKGRQQTALGYIWRYNKQDMIEISPSKQILAAVNKKKMKLEREKIKSSEKMNKENNEMRLKIAKLKPKTSSNK